MDIVVVLLSAGAAFASPVLKFAASNGSVSYSSVVAFGDSFTDNGELI